VYTNVVYVGRVHRVGCKSKNNNFCNFFGKKLEEILATKKLQPAIRGYKKVVQNLVVFPLNLSSSTNVHRKIRSKILILEYDDAQIPQPYIA